MFITKKQMAEKIAKAVAEKEKEDYFMGRLEKIESKLYDLEHRVSLLDSPGLLPDEATEVSKNIGY